LSSNVLGRIRAELIAVRLGPTRFSLHRSRVFIAASVIGKVAEAAGDDATRNDRPSLPSA